MLDMVESPLVTGGDSVTADELLLAAKICSAPVRIVNGCYLPDVSFNPTWRDQLRLAWVTLRRDRMMGHIKAWGAYVGDYMTTPEQMQTPGHEPATVSAPSIFALAILGVKLFGEARAWSMPFGMLKTSIDVYSELRGAKIKFAPDPEEVEKIKGNFDEADQAGAAFMESIKRGMQHN